MGPKADPSAKTVASNRRALHDYEILERFDIGRFARGPLSKEDFIIG